MDGIRCDRIAEGSWPLYANASVTVVGNHILGTYDVVLSTVHDNYPDTAVSQGSYARQIGADEVTGDSVAYGTDTFNADSKTTIAANDMSLAKICGNSLKGDGMTVAS
jgi:hypothetical protein